MTGTRRPGTGREQRSSGRLARVVLALTSTAAVVVGAALALRRRPPALPRYPAEAQQTGAPRHSATARPAPEPAPTPETSPRPEPSPAPAPAPVASAPGGSTTDEDPPTRVVESLTTVSGIGRRSAEALEAAGITSLEQLAGTDDATLAAALDAAGVRRSPTLSTWAGQARRLTEA